MAMVFKLVKTAERNWRTLKRHPLLAQVVQGVKFKDGLRAGTQKDRRLMTRHHNI